MTKRWLPFILLGVLYLAFLILLAGTVPAMPERVASHFDTAGQPDGWMTRSGYTLVLAVFGLVIPGLVIGLTYLTRFFPDWMINLPHKQYWLSPENRAESLAYLFHHSLWLGSLTLLLLCATHYLTVKANQAAPVHLDNSHFLGLMGFFAAGMVFWIISLFRHFRKHA